MATAVKVATVKSQSVVVLELNNLQKMCITFMRMMQTFFANASSLERNCGKTTQIMLAHVYQSLS
jgi:hypothetical protein